MSDLLSLLLGWVSRRVIVARSRRPIQVRGLDRYLLISPPPSRIAQGGRRPGTGLFLRSETHVSSSGQRRCHAVTGVDLDARCLAVPKTGGIDTEPHSWYISS